MCKITRVPFQIFVIYFYKRQKRGINLHSMGYSFLIRFSFVLCNPIHITLFVSLILFPYARPYPIPKDGNPNNWRDFKRAPQNPDFPMLSVLYPRPYDHGGKAALKATANAVEASKGALGCDRIYFDFGSNIGVQIRKLFEPEHYAGAEALPLFDAAFGSFPQRAFKTCAFGIEVSSGVLEKAMIFYFLIGLC